ncbi:flagella biosynthesis protein FliZ, partial [Escherichia coli]|nr:flagella biosynthesis protein FliZ [Escherichia coli]
VENIGGTTVGQNRSVQLIKVGKRVLVVGVADSIQLLKEIDDEQECEAIVKQYEEAMESKTDLPKMVQKFTSQIKKHDQTTTSSFSANLKAQLAELKKTQSEVRKKGPKQNE